MLHNCGKMSASSINVSQPVYTSTHTDVISDESESQSCKTSPKLRPWFS